MEVGYAVLYEDGELTISKEHTLLQKKIDTDYGEFIDTDVPWKTDIIKIERVQILDSVKTNSVKEWFKVCLNLTNLIDFQNLDVSDCINFFGMFDHCEKLIDISCLSNWNVSNGKDFSFMFYNCKSLVNINSLENWNVSNGKNFEYMFCDCENLINISSLENWDVSNGRDFEGMFCNCRNLMDINSLENWNVSNGENFVDMFSYCEKLKNIYLSNILNQLNKNMFYQCNPNLKIHWKEHIYTYEDLTEYESF